MRSLAPMLMVLLTAATVFAGQAEVLQVRVELTGDGHYTFYVTVKHDDTGWQHFADKWDVLGPDGKVLGTRVLTPRMLMNSPLHAA